jgi:hypothetical protein
MTDQDFTRIKNRLVVLRAQTVAAITRLQENQSRAVDADRLLTSLDSQIRDHLLKLAAAEVLLQEIRREFAEQQPEHPTT